MFSTSDNKNNNGGPTVSPMIAMSTMNTMNTQNINPQFAQNCQTASVLGETREILYRSPFIASMNEQQMPHQPQHDQNNTSQQNNQNYVAMRAIQFQQPQQQVARDLSDPNNPYLLQNSKLPACSPPTYEHYRQSIYMNNGNHDQFENQTEAPKWVTSILKSLDARLKSIEMQLSNQNSRWQHIDSQLQNQNRRLLNMEETFSQINTMQQTVSQMKINVSSIDSQINEIHSSMSDYNQSISYVSDLCDGIVSENSENKESVDNLCKRMSSIEMMQGELQSKQQQSEDKLTDLQWRSMRENLLFSGIEEETDVLKENVESKLYDFLSSKLNISDDIPFDRVHRLGKYDKDQTYPRAIIAKFHRFRDREKVRLAAPEALKGTDFGVREQFPIEIENKRKALYPVMKAARVNKNNKVRLVRDKLFINNVQYIQPTQKTDGQDARPKTYKQQVQRRQLAQGVNNNRTDSPNRDAYSPMKGPQRTVTSRHVYSSRTRINPVSWRNNFETPNRFEGLTSLPRDDTTSNSTSQGRKKKKPASSPLEIETNLKKNARGWHASNHKIMNLRHKSKWKL